MGAGNSSRSRVTVATALVRAAKATGTRRIFGLPGGGSSLDLIDAARREGLDFVLTRHECAAVFMASATSALDGALGVAVTTKGPGAANAANGAAQASLDRCPVAIVTDGFSPRQQAYVTHQWFDQRAMLAPLVKGHGRLDDGKAAADIGRLVATALAPRRGPVHVELTGPAARAEIRARKPRKPVLGLARAARATLDRARAMIARARRPVVVAGLEARDPGAAAAVRKLVAALDCPALVTYQAKGVVADGAPQYVGIFTGGLAEQPTVKQADLIILAGLDPVELILQPWPYDIPVLDIGYTRHPVHYVKPKLGVYGDLARNLAAVRPPRAAGGWQRAGIRRLREDMRASLAYRGRGGGLTPQQVVEEAALAARKLPRWPRATVDAGAHMFSATAFWPCARPNDVLISNGLATMAYALPAAIASALHEPGRAAVAFTGDGGLKMCLGELATAAQENARVVVVVFNDGALSLIDIKQQSRRLPAGGVRWKRPDFAAAMRGMGGRGYRARTLAEYRRALAQAFAGSGPALVDVVVDPSGYGAQLAAMRG
jgi:acetolactate synthase-1/2/3 large subunit